MKNLYKILGLLLTVVMINSCGNQFLETEHPTGNDEETALETTSNIVIATEGLYNRFYNYRFAGNYMISIGDIPTDMATFDDATAHFTNIFKYTVNVEDLYLENLWSYGYKVIDGAARVIKASNEIMEAQSPENKKTLKRCIAEARTLRGLATLYLTNIFGLPIKVNGTVDNSFKLGIVAIDEPINPFEKVERSSIAECYASITTDFALAITTFTELTGNNPNSNHFSLAAAEALYARALLYMENYDEAKIHAKNALDKFNGTMIHDKVEYEAMYKTTATNSESIFKLAIDAANAWSANSSGTLWTNYGYSPSFAYKALLKPNDIRNFIVDSPGGKFTGEGGNPAVSPHFMVRIPEMYLIIAECELKSTTGTIANAKDALLNVAKRDLDIIDLTNLPNTKADLITFLEEERARELFQEGHRFYDLRRWGKLTGVIASATDFKYNNYDIAKFCYPIPDAELRGGYGVVQNDGWAQQLPK